MPGKRKRHSPLPVEFHRLRVGLVLRAVFPPTVLAHTENTRPSAFRAAPSQNVHAVAGKKAITKDGNRHRGQPDEDPRQRERDDMQKPRP